MRVVVQVKIWFQNRRSKVKKMMKQHQHGGPVNTSSTAAANGGASGGGLGPTSGTESHSVHAGGASGLAPPTRDCWTHQTAPQHDQVPRRTLDDQPSPPRRDVIDEDDDDEPNKKPLHLLQLQTAMHRFSPPEHAAHHPVTGAGVPLKTGGVPSYRASPTSLHPVPRYHHAQHGTPMASPIHAWPDTGVDMLPPAGLQHPHGHHHHHHHQQQQQQQQRLHAGAPGSNQPSAYPGSAYMTDMTSASYHQSWYAAGTTQQMHQTPAHHLPTLLS